MSNWTIRGWSIWTGLSMMGLFLLWLPGEADAFFYLAHADHSYDSEIEQMGIDSRLDVREDEGDTRMKPQQPSGPLPLETDRPLSRMTQDAPDTYYQEIGDGLASPVAGFGNRVPLREALFLLLPEDWRANTELVPPMNVSWDGGNTWTKTLRHMARDKQIQVVVNWKRQSVDVKPLPDQPLVIAEGEKLSDGLERWTKRSGWTLAWEARRDYPVAVTTVFSKGFVESVRHLSRTLWEHGVPLKMTLYKGNKVLGVEVSQEVLNFEQ